MLAPMLGMNTSAWHDDWGVVLWLLGQNRPH
jgi:hypothetical protein